MRYGQVPAALLWLPVLVEYVYFAGHGEDEGWEGRLPYPSVPVEAERIGLDQNHVRRPVRALNSAESAFQATRSLLMYLCKWGNVRGSGEDSPHFQPVLDT
jgi:hypothetical protein